MTRVDRSHLPAIGPDPTLTCPAVTTARLPNGLTIQTVEQRALPVITFILLVPMGASADPLDRPGLASLTGDMLDEGSGEWSAIDVQDALARIGAVLDIEVGPDATFVTLTTLSRNLDRALELLAEIVVRPALRDEDVTRVRTLRGHRLRQLRDSPSACADRAFVELVYRGHPYGHLSIGNERTLQIVTREEVAAFHEQAYRPTRATLVAVGDASHDTVQRAVAERLGMWTPSSAAEVTPGDPASAPPPVEPVARLVLLDRPGAPQSELRIGHPGVSRRIPDYHALLVMNTLLGGHFVSRINMNLRERKGYTYGARTSFDFRRGPGPFLLSTSVQTSATSDAIRESLDEIDAIRGRRPATPAEVRAAKAALTRGYPRNFETSPHVARAIAQLALHELPADSIEQFVPRVNQVGPELVTDVARRYLDPERSLTVIVGDRNAIEASLLDLGIGEPIRVSQE